MLTKPQYTVQDWLDLHGLTSKEVLDYCGVIRQKFQFEKQDESGDLSKGLSLDLEQSLERLVFPALHDLLGTAPSETHDLSVVKIVKHKAGSLDLPFTEWDTTANAPAIHLVWSGTADDLICLAHEVAHAAQMILSNGAFTPPVAREACAFLGELALIRYAKSNSHTVYRELQFVWHHENQRYLGNDIIRLASDLKSGSASYHYRHNYPLARVAAMALLAERGAEAITNIFSRGAAAMEAIKLQDAVQSLRNSGRIQASRRNASEADEDITAFRMSLSPKALRVVRAGQVDYAWLYRPAGAGCVIGDSVEDVDHLPAQLWVKWRSLGVFALAALNRGEADTLPSVFLEEYEKAAAEPPGLRFSTLTPWVQTLKFDALTALGMTIQQLAASPYHQQFKLSYYLPVEILPPLKAEQFRCFLDAEGCPIGLTTWAWLSDRQKQDIHKTGRELHPEEWTGGQHPFVNDWITEPAAFRAVMTEKRDVIFPDHIVSSLRRNPDGSVRRVNKWVGRNLLRRKLSNRQDVPGEAL